MLAKLSPRKHKSCLYNIGFLRHSPRHRGGSVPHITTMDGSCDYLNDPSSACHQDSGLTHTEGASQLQRHIQSDTTAHHGSTISCHSQPSYWDNLGSMGRFGLG